MSTNNKTNPEHGCLVWLTGLSGAGKTTIADRLADLLKSKNIKVQRLDGNLVKGCFGTEFEDDKKREHDLNTKLAAFISHVLEAQSIMVIASFVSPHQYQRELVRNSVVNYVEVYIKASLDACINRDVKGFYKELAEGKREYLPGYTEPYEEPSNPDLVINTEEVDVESAVKMIMECLDRLGYINV